MTQISHFIVLSTSIVAVMNRSFLIYLNTYVLELQFLYNINYIIHSCVQLALWSLEQFQTTKVQLSGNKREHEKHNPCMNS
jgi:hypothetical protein